MAGPVDITLAPFGVSPLTPDGGPSMTTNEILLWDVLPYVTIAVFVVGMFWRFATTSSVGPPGLPSSTSARSCASPARCSTSACWPSSAVTSSAC